MIFFSMYMLFCNMCLKCNIPFNNYLLSTYYGSSSMLGHGYIRGRKHTVLALVELTVQCKYFELYSTLIYTSFLLFLIWYSDSLKCSFVGGHSASPYFAVTTNIITNILAYLY